MKYLFESVFFLLLMIPSYAFTQQGEIKGTVFDKSTGEPMIGANVVIPSLNIGDGKKSFYMNKSHSIKKGVYTMVGWIYVTEGATLTIEPGTIIKGTDYYWDFTTCFLRRLTALSKDSVGSMML